MEHERDHSCDDRYFPSLCWARHLGEVPRPVSPPDLSAWPVNSALVQSHVTTNKPLAQTVRCLCVWGYWFQEYLMSFFLGSQIQID